jgi:hypothetical protein
MHVGLLFVKKTRDGGNIQELYLPIFHENREQVHSILIDAMDSWELRKNEVSFYPLQDFFSIVETLGRERTRSHLFIGPESVPFETLQTAIRDRPFVFTVDFERKKIISLK